MSVLTIPEAVLAPLVRQLGPADLDRDAVVERAARVVWSVLSEPGDRAAGALVQLFGAERAVRAIVDRPNPAVLAARVADAGDTGLVAEWRAALERWMPRFDPDAVVRALRQAARFGVQLVVPGDRDWPVVLDDLDLHAPHLLWVRGDRSRLAELAGSGPVAVVGARAATGYGDHVAIELSGGLVDRGHPVVSGGAYGIDGTAHRAALAGGGLTVAVLAGGLDRFYPSGHEQLLTRIEQRGVIVGEVPPGTTPTKWRFLQRNRVIAALGAATVVVEAGWRSGSLNTAHHALSLGRPVGAVPGPVTSAASVGCHQLLRESEAVCVTTAAEAAQLAGGALAPAPGPGRPRDAGSVPDPDGVRVRLLDAMSPRASRSPAQLAAAAGLALDRVRAELGLLELDGVVREHPTGWRRVVR
jgi:DNA processing protein